MGFFICLARSNIRLTPEGLILDNRSEINIP